MSRGKTLFKIAVGITMFGAGVLTYMNYQELRKKEAEDIREAKKYNEEHKDDIYTEMDVPKKKTTGEMAAEALKKTGADAASFVLEHPGECVAAFAVGLGLAKVYDAGYKDGGEESYSEGYNYGSCVGFEAGRDFMWDHIEKSSPEWAGRIHDNLSIWEKMHKGSPDMVFDNNMHNHPDGFEDKVNRLYSNMKK